MDFNKPSNGFSTPHFPEKHDAPDNGDGPAGADWFLWNLTLGPADSSGPSSPNPMSPSNPDPMPSLLASVLHWGVPAKRK